MGIVIDLIESKNTRSKIIEGKQYISFTPSPVKLEGYFNGESLDCQVESYYEYKFGPHQFMDESLNISAYVKSTLAKLLYNNFALIESYDELAHLFNNWVSVWSYNRDIGNCRDLVEGFREEIWGLTKEELTVKMSGAEVNDHWYPQSIELIEDSRTRMRAKVKARFAIHASSMKAILKEVAKQHKSAMLQVLPTQKFQCEETGLSSNVVKKYGEDCYISAGEQKKELIKEIIKDSPEIKQYEVVDFLYRLGIKISLVQVKRCYKKIKEEALQAA